MNVAMSLRQALLDLGLEDLIPLPEIPTDEDIRKVLEPRTVEDLGTALIGTPFAGWRATSAGLAGEPAG